ncbi:TetR/AcrR family transcriptional regulator [Desulfobulbus sp. US2]|nr:TetR/AcrR family transcriptional regulator [Desulfobulbus sp. US4]MCW5207128.1 TetR/AcrR family transcriptional regulator [Desulfobulbus sp. US2]MCW5214841.1 TetR/AcrR family transcriptional regulator [Desulfobulbus sp. US5]WLE95414.1 MAG: TetR/AcrR family transcriptional regulator [Candidatus Electrothrix communis]
MAGLREQKKKATRAAIMEAAINLFGERGYQSTSVSSLAKAAGIGKGTIYSYFTSKNEILLAFCEDELTFIHDEIQKKLNPDAPLAEKMLLVLMSEFCFVTKNKDFGRTLLRELTFPKEITIEKSRVIEERFLNLFVKIFKEGQERGQLRRDIELIITGGHFYGLYLMALSAWYSGRLHTEDDVRESLELMINQALTGLTPQETPAKAINQNNGS